MGFLREPSHILIVLVVLLVLFGGRRLPEAARGLGRSMRIFKSEMKQMQDDETPRRASTQAEPLEGRVVDPDRGTARSAEQQPRDL